MDAILDYCEKIKWKSDAIAPLISKPLKEKIEADAKGTELSSKGSDFTNIGVCNGRLGILSNVSWLQTSLHNRLRLY